MENTTYGTPAIVIFDCHGKDHKVLAVKPHSSHPSDWYLLTVITVTGTLRTPFVVHTMNLRNGSFCNGAYCEDMTVALGVFNRR